MIHDTSQRSEVSTTSQGLTQQLMTAFHNSATQEIEPEFSHSFGISAAEFPKLYETVAVTVLARIVELASKPDGPESVVQRFEKCPLDQTTGRVSVPGGLLTEPQSGEVEPQELFGNQYGGVLNALAQETQVGRSALGPLLGSITPSVVRFLAQQVQALKLSPLQACHWLTSERSAVLQVLPEGLLSLLGAGIDSLSPPHEVLTMGHEAQNPHIPTQPVLPDTYSMSDAHISLRRLYTWPLLGMTAFTLFLLLFSVQSCGSLQMNSDYRHLVSWEQIKKSHLNPVSVAQPNPGRTMAASR